MSKTFYRLFITSCIVRSSSSVQRHKMSNGKVTSKLIAFRVNSEDAINDSEMRRKLDAFCTTRSIENVFVGKDGDILLSSPGKKISLNTGVQTLQGILGLSYTPNLLTQYQPLPSDWLNLEPLALDIPRPMHSISPDRCA